LPSSSREIQSDDGRRHLEAGTCGSRPGGKIWSPGTPVPPEDEFSMSMTIPEHSVLARAICLGLLSAAFVSMTSSRSTADDKPKAATSSGEKQEGKANRLAKESSPYLLMHAHNPVDWYAWGPEAFEKARSEKKPIFLSIGYSSCYWCHVMERQTFTSQKVADYLNQHFVSIKVDREERPDVDDIYMTSLIVYQQAAGRNGGGGWPLSMFLTSDGQPIAGATYLPPEDTEDGRTGFLSAAERIHDLWTNNKEAVDSTSEMLAREVRRLSGPALLGESRPLTADLLTTISDHIEKRYDATHGGVDFNPRSPNGPRFPNVPRLQFLLNLYEQDGDKELLKIVDHSLTAMAQGGIRDHLGGGFHRYSTDRQWMVPHFEKMLYDQAQLLEMYSHAARLTDSPLYHQVANELVTFLADVMTLPGGGFCSALDAETNAIEGEYYVWTREQVQSALTPEETTLFLEAYGFAMPQDFEHGRVLFMPVSVAELAKNRSTAEDSMRESLKVIGHKLLAIRDQRERPFLDDKVLTEWNAQVIQSLAVHGRLPGKQTSLQLAVDAADFLLANLRSADGKLLRSWRKGVAGGPAYLDDYASLVSALLALHESTNDPKWLDAAAELNTQQMAMFFDETQSTFFFTSHDHEKLLARSSSPYDSISPSGNSMAVRNMLKLAALKSDAGLREKAEKILARFSGTMESSPSACAGLGMALQDLLKQKETEPAKAAVRRPANALGTEYVLTSLQVAGDESKADESKVDAAGRDETTLDEQSAFKPVLPDPASSPFKRNYDERPVKAKIYPYFDKLPKGGKCPVAIELTIAKDWHINANPANPDFLIPTEVTIKSGQKVKMTKVKYPKHELLQMEGQNEPSHVYGKTVIVYTLLEVDAGETADKADLEVEIKFQACNEKTCEPPDTIKLKGKLTLAASADELKRVNESKFPKDGEETKDDEEKKEESSDKEEEPKT
jgi:uncharacterized protein YyaL (SSP411 family)